MRLVNIPIFKRERARGLGIWSELVGSHRHDIQICIYLTTKPVYSTPYKLHSEINLHRESVIFIPSPGSHKDLKPQRNILSWLYVVMFNMVATSHMN